LRTGDDLGRFHLQHRLGITLFGLHGSFILVRNSVVKQSTFDVGPAGSITEDAWWALVQMDRGRRCRWVDGYVVEQSPETIRDFIKQRRRWFVGLCKCVLHAPTRLRYRYRWLSRSSFGRSPGWAYSRCTSTSRRASPRSSGSA
jgi:egghead protein (zeste-white 4 protein)